MVLPLDVSNLRVNGDDGRTILSVDRLSIAAGTALGIRGPSGAGKSTMLFALAGLANVSAGRIAWGDIDIAALGESDRAAFRRGRVGMIFQDYLLFEELSALANASLANSFSAGIDRRDIERRAAETLTRLGIDAGARSVASFSGGERQRVAVARALATDPEIILADEPTASLDRMTADRLIDDLAELARESGKTLIVVSHDTSIHRKMDRLIDIVDGAMADEVSSVA